MKRVITLCICMFCVLSISAQNWDINTLHKINSWDSKFVRNYSKFMSKSAPYISIGIPVGMAIYGGITKNKPILADALYIGTSLGVAVVFTSAIKLMVDRERPYDRYPDLIHPYSREKSSSFPSSHTATAFSVATSLSIRYPKWYVIAPSALWATSVGFSRMTEGVHYPSDVITGAVIGAGCAVVNIYVNRALNRWLFGWERTPKVINY